MQLALRTEYMFHASHSLPGDGGNHDHQWKLRVELEGFPIQGKLVDLPLWNETIEMKLLAHVRGRDLNTCIQLGNDSRGMPTCENLVVDFWKAISTEILPPFRLDNKSLRLFAIEVELFDADGSQSFGSIRMI